MRIPRHIGIIPDGNRRWAKKEGLRKEDGYENGLEPGVMALRACKSLGVEEVTFYGFTVDNTKRPKEQTIAFTNACIKAVELMKDEGASVLVIGNVKSKMFPNELKRYAEKRIIGEGNINVNFLVNYSWEWDLRGEGGINSKEASRVDLIIRWGGMRRLSGFLPIQAVYSDFYIVNELWPDYRDEHIIDAIKWYDRQDITLGG